MNYLLIMVILNLLTLCIRKRQYALQYNTNIQYVHIVVCNDKRGNCLTRPVVYSACYGRCPGDGSVELTAFVTRLTAVINAKPFCPTRSICGLLW